MTGVEEPGAGPGPGRRPSGISRRSFLGAAAAVTGAAVVGGLVGQDLARGGSGQPGEPSGGPGSSPAGSAAAGSTATAGSSAAAGSAAAGSSLTPSTGAVVPFRGLHQAGIATPAQDRLAIAAFDITTTDRAELVDLLRGWTRAAELMTAGQPAGDVEAAEDAPAADTGEALGLSAARLTLTIGFGPSLFDKRFGLEDRRPSALIDLPPFRREVLDPDLTGGDLVVQACADDPQVAFHAVRDLARFGRGAVVVRWFQLGFGRTSSTSASQATPRNLMGFKDGTNNVLGDDPDNMDRHIWVGADTDQPWMVGGSYVVTRRIRMLIEAWDRASFGEQERIFGRTKVEGAPFGGTREHDPVDLTGTDAAGNPLIATDAHIRLAAPSVNNGEKILRRGYSFTDGMDPVTGELDAGLFFIAYQRDARKQFVPIQTRLSANDSLNEYIKHTGSGIFACPPGLAADSWWGETLLHG